MAQTLKIAIEIDAKNNARPVISQARRGVMSISQQLARLQRLAMGVTVTKGLAQTGRAFVSLAEGIQLSNSRLALAVGNMRKAAQVQKEIAVLARQTVVSG